MSRLKDIMDVDMEPLESQAYRRSWRAAKKPHSLQPSDTLSQKLASLSKDGEKERRGKASSNRGGSYLLSPNAPNSTAMKLPDPKTLHLPAVTPEEMMDCESSTVGAGPRKHTLKSCRSVSTTREKAADRPLRYTPVTGRISRAKKGVPVHKCDICRPTKIFTRAEHLRRHTLSHQNPAFPCSFEDCHRAFHRSDLLARHQRKHENSDENTCESEDQRSRTMSVASDYVSPSRENTKQPEHRMHSGDNSPGRSVTYRNFATNAVRYRPILVSSPGTTSVPIVSNTSKGESPTKLWTTLDKKASPQHRMFKPNGSPLLLALLNSFDDSSSMPRTRNVGAEARPDSPTDSNTAGFRHLDSSQKSLVTGLSYPQESFFWCLPASSGIPAQSEGVRERSYWYLKGTMNSSTIATTEIIADADPRLTQALKSAMHNSRTLDSEPDQEQYNDYYRMDAVIAAPTVPVFDRTLPQPRPASSPRFTHADMGICRRSEEIPLISPRTGNPPTIDAYLAPHQNLDKYIDSYFLYFHQIVPIIHRPTFKQAENSLLTCAMAAIGTQYHGALEARAKGSELNEACREVLSLYSNWTTYTLQAILLIEIFTRFRARRTTVRPSRYFEQLYHILSESPASDYVHNTEPNPRAEWLEWVDIESRRRLHGAAFMFDVHQSMYYEHPRSGHTNDCATEITLPCAEALWSARTTSEWRNHLSGYHRVLLSVAEQNISPESFSSLSSFTQSLFVCSFAARLPRREDATCPKVFDPRTTDANVESMTRYFQSSSLANVYLALHYTPLHDLLIVSGDTWAFSQKILPLSAFRAAQNRLRTWTSSLAAAQATKHACRILSVALSTPHTDRPYPPTFETLRNDALCICDYWSLYIAALICWAFGNRYQAGVCTPRSKPSSPIDSKILDDQPLVAIEDLHPKALHYIDSMLALNVEELLTSKATMKGETASIIDIVRQRLEVENVGNSSSLLVDAIGVLSKIRAGRKSWF